MAEGALFSLASKLLGVTSSPKFQTAYGQDPLILGAKRDLDKLNETIRTIQAVLLDAEKKQGDSAAIKAWIDGVRDALYDADDLLDLVTEDDLRRQQMKGTELFKEVRVLFSKLNPSISDNKIAKQVKGVRKRLDEISSDGFLFQFIHAPCENQMSALYQTQYAGSFLDEKVVIGRGNDKKAILEFLSDKSHAGQSLSVTAIVILGVGGVGKTTLAQLIYNDGLVLKNFESRCWASISDIYDEKEVLGRILGSIGMQESYHSFTINELYSAIMESMNRTDKYLLVLDNVWDCNASILCKIMTFLSSVTTEIRIIITTRDESVARAMGAEQIHQLEGLSQEESWELFKMMASLPEKEYTPDWTSLGRQIVDRCYGVPLYIKSVASLLSTKHSIEEWHDFANEKIDSLTSIVRLCYNPLPATLKQCFAYCSLFPKDYVFQKVELINLWIGQGFVMPMSPGKPVEEIGCEYLMALFNRSFFQEAEIDKYGEVLSFKMHDSMHDLAQCVAGDESIILTSQFIQNRKKIRHLSVGSQIDSSWNIPQSLSHMDRPPLRSFFFLYEGSLSPLVLDELLTKFKLLRALNLGHQNIEVLPSSIRELKHLRYLNLSNNKFTHLPDSITTLVNLLTLDISWCEQLEILPDEFRKLYNLRHFDNKQCYRLRHMPPGFEELTSLQCLSFFKVGNSTGAMNSNLYVLAALELKGELEIKFDEDMDWYGDECLSLPIGLRVLTIENFPGKILSYWVSSSLHNLVSLYIGSSSKIKHIPLLRGLPSLQNLHLSCLGQLEYVVTEEDEIRGGQSALFFPYLRVLRLEGLPYLKGWSRELVTEHFSCTTLPVLEDLTVRCCRVFELMPLCPCLKTLELNDVNQNLILHLLSTSLDASSSSASLSSLETIAIWGCDLLSFPGGNLTSLHHLEVRYCYELKNLYLVPPELNTLEQLVVQSCPELELWEEEKRGVDWDSLPKLCKLTVISMPNPDKLPDCLQQRQDYGNLLIKMK